MEILKIGFYQVKEQSSAFFDMKKEDKKKAMEIILQNETIYQRTLNKPPTGKIVLREDQYIFYSKWDNNTLIIDAVKETP